ncbi:MAG: HEAT repeat domain-containing protein [Desulfomonile tiedjei]|nr:HEAT repeat domain-containing protein [Desulfomonile tiedjei]
MATSFQNTDHGGTWAWAGVLFFGLGTAACFYCVYDLRYPNRFVGDMYNMEAMSRLLLLCFFGGLTLVGGAVSCVGWWKRRKRLQRVGTAITVVSSVVLITMAVDIGQSRHMNEVRRGYPEKSVEELLAIAREQEDQHAIDALMTKADPAAVPGLAMILLDDSAPGNLRYASAQALARIGGEDALKALEQAKGSSRDEHFREFLSHLLEQVRSVP